jgi:hypothetical protein
MFNLPANRVAAITTWLTAFVAFILGIVQVLPEGWQNYALIATGLLAKVATTLKFLEGSQRWDALTIAQGLDQPSNPLPPKSQVIRRARTAPSQATPAYAPPSQDE